MAKKPVQVWFVLWPDGKMFEGTQTSVSESHAIGAALSTWLIPEFFPKLEMGGLGYGLIAACWKSMQAAGFKCHCIDVDDATGVSR